MKLERKSLFIFLVCVGGVICSIALFFVGREVYSYYRYHSVDPIKRAELDKLNLDGYNKLMLVAHPDDETLWGGAHLIEDNYLVVCFTSRSNKVRSKEFAKSMAYSNEKFLMLDYPDKILGKRSEWEKIEKELKNDIRTLVEYKNWDCIVTHNKDGEYGHQHHKSLNRYVTQVSDEKDFSNKLHYFGTYYSKDKIEANKNTLNPISDEVLIKKKEMISIYESQSFVESKFGHMYGYEFKL